MYQVHKLFVQGQRTPTRAIYDDDSRDGWEDCICGGEHSYSPFTHVRYDRP